ncbi:hypothetical protein MGG_15976 [Pyricularia oryzae 70-15]|uniref:Uncharacterized protein n=2 Tax=Pyricularia oryzae TaxID=318829 RepID=G4MXW8_PYRO7|nr:uncharacterized protein MGG_15976 [Pyricularia oryzae 70-15]EHA56058.1 hypothetical protein MGG_15976 [Pyricularia oryzae 70-15]
MPIPISPGIYGLLEEIHLPEPHEEESDQESLNGTEGGEGENGEDMPVREGGDSDMDVDVDEDEDEDGNGENNGDDGDDGNDGDNNGDGGNDEEEDQDEESYEQMISDSQGLKTLIDGLRDRFDLENIGAISYAVAVCIYCVEEGPDGTKEVRCLTVDRNQIAVEYPQKDYTFYPQAFHPAYGNMSSPSPPEFLKPLTTTMKSNASRRNESADVLSFGYFQGYSNVKRNVRHSPKDLLPTKGFATAAFTIPATDAAATAAARDRRKNLINIVRGVKLPEYPDATKPFARELFQMETAIEQNEFAYRLEQMLSINVANMKAGKQRTFTAIFRPIFQLMRFFLLQQGSFVHIFRSLSPAVFPRIFSAYCRLFELAYDEMDRRFVRGHEFGLDLANSEGTAFLDRMGGYCFTGFDRHLPKIILRHLGTIESLKHGAWPYLDPKFLDFGVNGNQTVINLHQWPRNKKNNRPIFLHISELRFHYGPRIASNRESNIWFSLLGGNVFSTPFRVEKFLKELIEEVWIPETRTFYSMLLRRRLTTGHKDAGRIFSLGETEQCQVAIREWDASQDPFSLAQLQLLFEGMDRRAPKTTSRTPHDFVASIFASTESTKDWKEIASKNALWYPTFQHAFLRAPKKAGPNTVARGEWGPIMTSCFLASGVEWVPGAVKGRLTAAVAIKLQGTANAAPKLAGRPGSLLRVAEEARRRNEIKMEFLASQQRRKIGLIDFDCAIPFVKVPNLICQGYAQAKHIFADKGDQKFTVAPKRKDPAQLALVMVTKMMWQFFPSKFTWTKDPNKAAHNVPEITKKIEHKGCNNRMLCQLGWTTFKPDIKRENPRTGDIIIQPRKELEERLRRLTKARNRPEDFIAIVFSSNDPIWVDRCVSIIKK